jgi:hypothetical protein
MVAWAGFVGNTDEKRGFMMDSAMGVRGTWKKS